MEAKLKELEHVCDLLKAAEENEQRILSWGRICAHKCKTLRELELQVVRTCSFLKINEKIKWKKVSGTFFTIGVCDSGEVIFVIFFINQKLMWK